MSWMEFVWGDDVKEKKRVEEENRQTMDTFRFRAYTADLPEAAGFIFETEVNDEDKLIYLKVVDDKAGKMERWLASMKDDPQVLVIDFHDEYNNIVCRKLYKDTTTLSVTQKLNWKENMAAHFTAVLEFDEYERQENPKRQA